MLPPWLKKILQTLGINTVRLEWKLRYWRENTSWSRTPFARWFKTLSYEHKYCKCGALVDKNAEVCPHCGEAVGSRLAYRISRALGFVTPEFGIVWIGLLVMIAGVFLVELKMDGLKALMGPSDEMLLRLGALHSYYLATGQYWRFLSAGLIHIGLIHVAFNTMAIAQLSSSLEEETGPWLFIVLVTVSQLGCTLMSWGFHTLVYSGVYSAGASGIAFGLIGFGFAYLNRLHGKGHPLRDFYLKWAIYAFLFGLFIGADNAGHIGGLAAGIGLAYVLPVREAARARLAPLWKSLAVVSLVAWGYALVSMYLNVINTGGL